MTSCLMGCARIICDVIKQNKSELANNVFKIQPNKDDSFFCFLLFVKSFNCLYLWNQLTNLCRGFTKLKPKQYPNRKCQKSYFSTSDSFCLIASHIFAITLVIRWKGSALYESASRCLRIEFIVCSARCWSLKLMMETPYKSYSIFNELTASLCLIF